MKVGIGYLERIDLNVINVAGSAWILDVQLEFAKLIAQLKRKHRSFRLLIDLTNARLEGNRQHLGFFLNTIEKHTAPSNIGPDGICIVVMNECPLRKELVTMSDLFRSKLVLLDKRHPAFVLAPDRTTAIKALDASTIAGA